METIKRRLVWTLAILVFFFSLAAARTGYIQVVRGEQYSRMALAGGTSGVSLEDYPRGKILDRHYRPLTGSYNSNSILVFPELLEDQDSAAKALSVATGAGLPAVSSVLSGGKPAVLPIEEKDRETGLILETGWKGVLVAPFSFRYGPRPLAAHVVGHLGKIRDTRELEELNSTTGKNYRISDWAGRQGLEFFYEKDLRGMYPAAYAGLYTDALGKPLSGLPVLVNTKMDDSTRCDVATTIDANIQDMVERVMDRHIKKGAVVVMDSSTGDLLAVASRPGYNPNPAVNGLLPATGDERFVNQAVSLFQPGSVFKVVVAAAALSEGIATPGTRFFCGGSGDRPIGCWKKEGHGSITLEEAFAQSCNPVFAKLGLELGPQRMISCARSLGMESQLIAGYPAAADRRQDLSLIAGRYNLANSSVGQGPVLATPVQITAMINTIAGGGIYLQPRLVREIRPAGSPPRAVAAGEPVRAISPQVAARVGVMMEMVTKHGVGTKAWVSRGGTAGKTGSAQPGNGVESVNAWFSGYGPLACPRYTVTVLAREGVSGGETAAPVFREIMENLLAGEEGIYSP